MLMTGLASSSSRRDNPSLTPLKPACVRRRDGFRASSFCPRLLRRPRFPTRRRQLPRRWCRCRRQCWGPCPIRRMIRASTSIQTPAVMIVVMAIVLDQGDQGCQGLLVHLPTQEHAAAMGDSMVTRLSVRSSSVRQSGRKAVKLHSSSGRGMHLRKKTLGVQRTRARRGCSVWVWRMYRRNGSAVEGRFDSPRIVFYPHCRLADPRNVLYSR